MFSLLLSSLSLVGANLTPEMGVYRGENWVCRMQITVRDGETLHAVGEGKALMLNGLSWDCPGVAYRIGDDGKGEMLESEGKACLQRVLPSLIVNSLGISYNKETSELSMTAAGLMPLVMRREDSLQKLDMQPALGRYEGENWVCRMSIVADGDNTLHASGEGKALMLSGKVWDCPRVAYRLGDDGVGEMLDSEGKTCLEQAIPAVILNTMSIRYEPAEKVLSLVAAGLVPLRMEFKGPSMGVMNISPPRGLYQGENWVCRMSITVDDEQYLTAVGEGKALMLNGLSWNCPKVEYEIDDSGKGQMLPSEGRTCLENTLPSIIVNSMSISFDPSSNLLRILAGGLVPLEMPFKG